MPGKKIRAFIENDDGTREEVTGRFVCIMALDDETDDSGNERSGIKGVFQGEISAYEKEYLVANVAAYLKVNLLYVIGKAKKLGSKIKVEILQ
jgi:hypothetical protein